MKTRMALPVAALIMSAVVTNAAEYVVSQTGNDAWPGTAAQPFRTIKKAVSVMTGGDRCRIRAGIYHEALCVDPEKTESGAMEFSAEKGERVIITAGAPVSGWRRLEGNLYQAPIEHDLGTGNNQVFVDGVWRLEARWPNATQFQDEFPEKAGDFPQYHGNYDLALYSRFGKKAPWIQEPLLAATLWRIRMRFAEGGSHRGNSPTPGVFPVHSSKSCILWGKPDDYWVGTGYSDPGWWYGSGVTIAASHDEGDTVHFTFETNKMRWCGKGYFFGHRDFIDTPYEWVIQDGVLTMLFEPGDDPGAMDIRVKSGYCLFNLSGCGNVTLRNVVFHGGSVQLDSAQGCIVDHCHFKYLSHYELIEGNGSGADPDKDSIFLAARGIRIGGSGNRFVNSSIEYSAANGLIMRGTNNRIENNFIRVISYKNSYAAPLAGLRKGDVLTRNTIAVAGRSAINGATGGTVTLNHFKDCMALSGDGGVLYTWGNYPLNMEIAWNWFDNTLGRPSQYLYCDADAYAYTVHHNVFMPSSSDRIYALACQGGEFYNNTWVCPHHMYNNFEYDYDKKFKSVGSWGLTMNELVASNDHTIDQQTWQFVNPEAKNFRLRESSPAIDAGSPIPGITGSFSGAAPDLGAYEYGGENWVPGHDWGAMPGIETLWAEALRGESAVADMHRLRALPAPVTINGQSGVIRTGAANLGGVISIYAVAGTMVFRAVMKTTRMRVRLPAGRYVYRFVKGRMVQRGECLLVTR